RSAADRVALPRRRQRRLRGGDDRRVLDLRDRQLGGVPRRAHLPGDRVLAADTAGCRGVRPAEEYGGGVGARAWRIRRFHDYTSESKVMSVETKDIENVVIVGSGPA